LPRAVEDGDRLTQAFVKGFEQFWDAVAKDQAVQLRGFASDAGQETINTTPKRIKAAKETGFMDQMAELRQLDKDQQRIAIRQIAGKIGDPKYANSLAKLLKDDRFAEVQKLLRSV